MAIQSDRKFKLIGGGMLLIVLLTTVINSLSNGWAQSLDVVVGGLLSLILVVLYFRQNEIQNIQADIMKDQRDSQKIQSEIMDTQSDLQELQAEIMETQSNLMSLEYEPEMIVEQCNFNSNRLTVNLKNVGRGTAKHLFLHTEIHTGQHFPKHDEGDIPNNAWHHSEDALFFKSSNGNEYVNSVVPLTRGDSKETHSQRFRGGVLGSGEETYFYTIPRVYVYPPGQGATARPLDDVMGDLQQEASIQQVSITFDLLYCAERGQPTNDDIRLNQLLARSFEIEEYPGIESFLSIGGSHGGTREHIIEQVKKYPKYPPNIQ